MALTDAETAIKTLINSASISGLTSSTTQVAPYTGNLIAAPELPSFANMPGKVVCVTPAHGGSDTPCMGNAQRVRRENVNVFVRSDVADYSGGLTLARAVWTALNWATVTGWQAIHVVDPIPAYGSTDEDGRHWWTMTVEMLRVVTP
jgi:hypothetical protein